MKRQEDQDNPPAIALFDLDGVLIQPGGYRHAVHDTIDAFSARLGLGALAPGEEEIALFESLGVTSEWDMVPMALTAALIRLGEIYPQQAFSLSAPAALPAIPPIPYREKILGMQPFLRVGLAPAEAVLEALRQGKLASSPGSRQVLETLLSGSRSVYRSPTTRLFQNLILGKEAFERAYGLPAQIETPSYLETYDRRLIGDTQRNAMLERVVSGRLRAAAITARPSLPPENSNRTGGEYSPEAEMAAGVAGLQGWPILGYGKMVYLAGEKGCDPESLLKPSPVQALAALLAAWKVDELTALEQAYHYVNSGDRLATPFPPKIEAHIFEDSPIGVQALQAGRKVLKQHGVELSLHAWGIATNPDKRQALEALGAPVFADINQALASAFGDSFRLGHM